ncbi:AarF/ABC1/UbiB kinase family protein [Hahella sp. CR1]|uniref:AarF/ABC1/UbiB kinase family protein n=1 Tax=Hahella sp. CR1 TaxID=2992807 RepID=UPI0024422C86|nr:AarF/ABC1/UbiB kinase family protein [Hahella sp. CR1]MDG9671685.1 AarF/ABC1/UbiB kinase family protein [Hahella sp. CR1]
MSESDPKKFIEINFPVLKQRTDRVLRGAGQFAVSTVKLPKSFLPIGQLILSDDLIDREQLAHELDLLFEALYQHPISEQSKALTGYLRKYKLIPNEETTEGLIQFLVKQTVSRSPVEIPEAIVNEFWQFFHELISAPELKGLVELNLDIIRSVLRAYEPLLVELINRIKHLRHVNNLAIGEMAQKARVLRSDLAILRRQIRAIRYIKPFLQTDPRDFAGQAQIVAKMVREFGPLFIKMAQVAAANAEFLPEEIATELKVFQEDVQPMTAEEVNQAFLECYGKLPGEIYFGFDVANPLRSGSIGSVYVAKKPVRRDGVEMLVPIVVKVSRHNLEREFQMGALALELMLISSQYWAPHTKLLPFLEAMSRQVKEFTRGFEQELNFEDEAAIQKRFYRRSQDSDSWSVPQIYSATGRIIEMEYLETALSVDRLLREVAGQEKEDLRRKVAERFLFTILQHVLVYQEFHGDLHPGNIMVTPEGRLFLIDWGNVVDMRGKWPLVWDYVYGALTADVERLTHALIEMSTHPEDNRRRREFIHAALTETLKKKGVTPLGVHALTQLYKEGVTGVQRRLQTVMHLLSNTYQLGIIVQSDYLHLSRSITAMAGAYLSMYEQAPRAQLFMDLGFGVTLFPYRLVRDRVQTRLKNLRGLISRV